MRVLRESVACTPRIHLLPQSPLVELLTNEHGHCAGAGRPPNIDALDLDKAGIQAEPNGIPGNDSMQTTNVDVNTAGTALPRRSWPG